MNKPTTPNTTVKQQEKAIKAIIKHYGDTIDLRKSPYVIAEIIREYAFVFPSGIENQSGPVPGSHGVPPPPPPSPDDMRDWRQQYTQLAKQMSQLLKKVDSMEAKLKRGGIM
jgi:hypothetical protein